MTTKKRRKKRNSTAQMAVFALALIAALSFLSVVAFKALAEPGASSEKDPFSTPVITPGGTVPVDTDLQDVSDDETAVKQLDERCKKVTTFIIGGVSGNNSCTDTMMLATYDGNDHSVKILQIPRDTYVNLSKGTRKINSAYVYGGGELMRSTVSELLGIPVDYYVVINTKVFRQIVDGIGGVTVTVPFDMNYEDPYQDLFIHLKKGTQTLNGSQAEGFVRYRDGYVDADIGRMQAMKEFLAAFMKQSLSLKNIFKLPVFIGSVFNNLETDIGLDDTIKLAGIALNMDMKNVAVYSLPGEACYVEAPGVSYKEWLFGAYEKETLDLINEKFNLYRESLTAKDISLVELSRAEAENYNQSEDTLASVDENGVKYKKKPEEQTKWYQSQQAKSNTDDDT